FGERGLHQSFAACEAGPGVGPWNHPFGSLDLHRVMVEVSHTVERGPVRVDSDHLMPRRLSWCGNDAYSLAEIPISVYELEESLTVEQTERWAGRGVSVGQSLLEPGILPVSTTEIVPRIRKPRHKASAARAC